MISQLIYKCVYTLSHSGWPFSLESMTLHVVTTIYICMEILVSGIPVRLAHIYQPLIYVALYILVTVVYYLAGGTDQAGDHQYIYEALDYQGAPVRAVISVLGLCLATLVCHFTVFFLYKLKIASIRAGGCCCAGDYDEVEGKDNDAVVTDQ